MSNNKISVHRRNLLGYGIGGAALATGWYRPIVDIVLLPAHAQTSGTATSITVSSLDEDNAFSRFVVIVDSADNVLANCGESGGTATLNDLSAGMYRVFADSEGPQNHRITVTTDIQSEEITVPTDTGTCNFLVATVELPSGTITPATGEQVTGPWNCSTNQGQSCS